MWINFPLILSQNSGKKSSYMLSLKNTKAPRGATTPRGSNQLSNLRGHMINLSYNGKSFNQRENDGYVNLGQLCATHGKKFSNWSRLNSSGEYLQALAETLAQSHSSDMSTGDLIVSTIGGKDGSQTWGHPLVAIEVARWISPGFGVWCNQHIKTLVETGSTAIASQQPPQPQLPERDTIDYITAASALEKLADSTLKNLLKDSLIDEIELRRNIKALSESDRPNPKKYTIAKVRAKMLGYSPEEIGNGTGLGKFIHSQIKPSFREFVGKYPVYHYEVTPEFDEAIHAYFSARRRSV